MSGYVDLEYSVGWGRDLMGSVSFNKIILYLLTGLVRGVLCVFFVCFLSDYTEFCFMVCVKAQISAVFCGVPSGGRVVVLR